MQNRYTVKLASILAALLLTLPSAQPVLMPSPLPAITRPSRNLVVVTIDGYRWQELFTGASRNLLSNPGVSGDTSTLSMLYWDEDPVVRRKLLMPFMWNVIAGKGQVWGNRDEGSKVNTANIYSVSYPGYNEMLTGTTDLFISSNNKKNNSNVNVLAWLNSRPGFEGRVAAFTSWDVFPFILNKEKAGIPVNSGYEMFSAASVIEEKLNSLQESITDKGSTRQDQISFIAAKNYMIREQPRVLFVGLGETDEFAHHNQYGEYLQQANRVDRMLADLWFTIQSTPGYKDQTTLLVTTDHGRGSRSSKWKSHSAFIRGSSQTWLAMIGPGIEPIGEVKEDTQVYQQELAAYMAALVGEEFAPPASWSSIVGTK